MYYKEYVEPKVLKIKSQSEVAKELMKNVRDKSKGLIPTFKTEYPGLNNILDGGIETNSIVTIAGSPGAGKSTVAELICYSIHKTALDLGFEILGLNINLEMIPRETLGRIVARESKKDSATLYSIREDLEEEEINRIEKEILPYLLKYNINYVTEEASADDIIETIYTFWKKNCQDKRGKKRKMLLVELDHTLLVESNDDDKTKVDYLYRKLKNLKIKIADEGGNVVYIILSQLNRNIMEKERINNPYMHEPIESDIFGSSAANMNSDYLIIAHGPGKLKLKSYTFRNLPVRVKIKETGKYCNFIYFELLKNRKGEPGLKCAMLAYFKYFTLIDITPEELEKFRLMTERGEEIILSEKAIESRIKSLNLNPKTDIETDPVEMG